jgi:hypothetical protein
MTVWEASRQPQTRDYHTRNGYSAHPNKIWEHPALLCYDNFDADAHLLWTILSQLFRYVETPEIVILGKGDNIKPVKVEKGQAIVSCRGLAAKIKRSPGYVGHKLHKLQAMGVIHLCPIPGSKRGILGTLVTDLLGVRDTNKERSKNVGRHLGTLLRTDQSALAQSPVEKSSANHSVALDGVMDDLKIESLEKKILSLPPEPENRQSSKEPSSQPEKSQPLPFTIPAPAPAAPRDASGGPQARSPLPKTQKPKKDKKASPRPSAAPSQPAKASHMPAEGHRLIQTWKTLGLHKTNILFQAYFLPLTILAVLDALAHVSGDLRRLLLAIALYSAKLNCRGLKDECACSFSSFFVKGVWLEYLPPAEPQEAAQLRLWLEQRLHPDDLPKLLGLSIPSLRNDGSFEISTTDEFKEFILHPNQIPLLRSLPFPVRWVDPDIASYHCRQRRLQQAIDDWQSDEDSPFHPLY